MATDWHPLTTGERALVKALLADDFLGRDELRAQLDGAEARTIDSDGSFALRVSGPHARVVDRLPVTGSTRDADGMGLEVLIHVIDGLMSEVEIYRDDGKLVKRQPDASTLQLTTLPVVG